MPRSATALTAEWLTAVLCRDVPGAVTELEVLGGSAGTSSRNSLRIRYNAAGRRAWERHLLARYLRRLGEEGITNPPGFDQAWLRYRQQPFHVLIAALATIGAGRLQASVQPRDCMLRCLERIATFINDHDSLHSIT